MSLCLVLAPRLAAAAASFCLLAAQIASARPASLSAGVMYAMALCNRTVLYNSAAEDPRYRVP
jgi:hypothetical protein